VLGWICVYLQLKSFRTLGACACVLTSVVPGSMKISLSTYLLLI